MVRWIISNFFRVSGTVILPVSPPTRRDDARDIRYYKRPLGQLGICQTGGKLPPSLAHPPLLSSHPHVVKIVSFSSGGGACALSATGAAVRSASVRGAEHSRSLSKGATVGHVSRFPRLSTSHRSANPPYPRRSPGAAGEEPTRVDGGGEALRPPLWCGISGRDAASSLLTLFFSPRKRRSSPSTARAPSHSGPVPLLPSWGSPASLSPSLPPLFRYHVDTSMANCVACAFYRPAVPPLRCGRAQTRSGTVGSVRAGPRGAPSRGSPRVEVEELYRHFAVMRPCGGGLDGRGSTLGERTRSRTGHCGTRTGPARRHGSPPSLSWATCSGWTPISLGMTPRGPPRPPRLRYSSRAQPRPFPDLGEAWRVHAERVPRADPTRNRRRIAPVRTTERPSLRPGASGACSRWARLATRGVRAPALEHGAARGPSRRPSPSPSPGAAGARTAGPAGPPTPGSAAAASRAASSRA